MNHHINPDSGLYQSLAKDHQKRILKASEEARIRKNISTKNVKDAPKQVVKQPESGFFNFLRSLFVRSKEQPV